MREGVVVDDVGPRGVGRDEQLGGRLGGAAPVQRAVEGAEAGEVGRAARVGARRQATHAQPARCARALP